MSWRERLESTAGYLQFLAIEDALNDCWNDDLETGAVFVRWSLFCCQAGNSQEWKQNGEKKYESKQVPPLETSKMLLELLSFAGAWSDLLVSNMVV